MKKFFAIVLLAGLLSFTACGNDDEVIRLGLVGDFQEHWHAAREILAEDGIYLEFVFFSDFMTPNRALNDGDIDLNAFQHKQFLANDSSANNYDLTYIAETFIVPLNIFNNQNRISSIADIQDGHTIAIPGDPVNYSRSLRLLESAGLIVLDTPPGQLATELDIVEWIVDINIMAAESGMLAQILPDVEAAIINGGNAFTAGLRPLTDSIFTEVIDGTERNNLTNVIVARSSCLQEGGRRVEVFNEIVRVFHSDTIRNLIYDVYQGAFIPVW